MGIQSEDINRRTDNGMAYRKKTKRQTIVQNRTLHKNLKIEQHEPH